MSSEPPAETIYDAIARDEVRKSLDGVPTDQEYADQRTRRKNSTDFARQPVALTDEQAAVLEAMTKDDPTYTMSQAIDRIVDGLRLEWKTHTAWAFVANTIFHDSGKYPNGLRYYVDHRGDKFMYWIGSNLTCYQCESLDHGKQLCLADYRTRFRAEIEKAGWNTSTRG